MLSNLPIGVYLDGQTLLHSLRARTKLLTLVWLAAMSLIANHRRFHFGTFIVAAVVLALALVAARVDLHYIWRRMRMLVVLLAVGIPFTLMWTPGATWRSFGPLVLSLARMQIPLGPVVITYDGIWVVFSFTAVFLLLYLGAILLTMTTTPVALAEAVVLLLRPLRRLGLPVHEFGLMTLVALRFVPLLVRETENLVRAQLARGADFTSGPLAARLRTMAALLVPMLQGALRRAEGLSAALEVRGYGVSAEATLLHEGPLELLDWAILIAVPLATLLAYIFL
jgi:energy-coupling factor transport system permease protein